MDRKVTSPRSAITREQCEAEIETDRQKREKGDLEEEGLRGEG